MMPLILSVTEEKRKKREGVGTDFSVCEGTFGAF